MSCGNPHETPCTEVLDRVYGYLDGELEDMDCAKIRQHLDECGPCGAAADFEAELRAVIASRCRDRVPEALILRVAAALAAEDARRQSTAGS